MRFKQRLEVEFANDDIGEVSTLTFTHTSDGEEGALDIEGMYNILDMILRIRREDSMDAGAKAEVTLLSVDDLEVE